MGTMDTTTTAVVIAHNGITASDSRTHDQYPSNE
jgi:hypothetical protein